MEYYTHKEMDIRIMRASIIIPYYNRPEQLRRCLWLLLRQTYPDYEIIVVDDGSIYRPTDIWMEVWEAGHTPGLMHMAMPTIREPGSPARPPNSALRYGYSVAKGEFVVLMGPEHMVPLYALERLVAETPEDRRGVPIQYCLNEFWDVDACPWQTNLDSLQAFPEFWTHRTDWGYTNEDAPGYRFHLAFSGARRAVWDRYDFLPAWDAVDDWTKDDAWLHGQELAADHLPHLLDDLVVYHQWHPKVYGNIPQYSDRIKRIRAGKKIKPIF